MIETIGMLDLKIARLKRRLKVIRQQIVMSIMYPHHLRKLRLTAFRVESRLEKLTRERQGFTVPSPVLVTYDD